MKFPSSLYDIDDVVLVKPQNDYHKLPHCVFTITSVEVDKRKGDDPIIRYGVKESRWMINERDVMRKLE